LDTAQVHAFTASLDPNDLIENTQENTAANIVINPSGYVALPQAEPSAEDDIERGFTAPASTYSLSRFFSLLSDHAEGDIELGLGLAASRQPGPEAIAISQALSIVGGGRVS
jgi:hypothetical protein